MDNLAKLKEMLSAAKEVQKLRSKQLRAAERAYDRATSAIWKLNERIDLCKQNTRGAV